MPYIKKEERRKWDKLIDGLILELKDTFSESTDGVINYIVTKIVRSVYPKNYFYQNRLMGVLECIKQEHYRTFLGPYEDEKIKQNGDVEC